MASIVESLLLHRPNPRRQQKPLIRDDFPNPRPARAGVSSHMLVARFLQPSHGVGGSRESGTKMAQEVAELGRVIRLPSNATSRPYPARTIYSVACSLL